MFDVTIVYCDWEKTGVSVTFKTKVGGLRKDVYQQRTVTGGFIALLGVVSPKFTSAKTYERGKSIPPVDVLRSNLPTGGGVGGYLG